MMKDLPLVTPAPPPPPPPPTLSPALSLKDFIKIERDHVASEHNYQKQDVLGLVLKHNRMNATVPTLPALTEVDPSLSPELPQAQVSPTKSDGVDSSCCGGSGGPEDSMWNQLGLDLHIDQDLESLGLVNMSDLVFPSNDGLLIPGHVEVCSPDNSLTTSSSSSDMMDDCMAETSVSWHSTSNMDTCGTSASSGNTQENSLLHVVQSNMNCASLKEEICDNNTLSPPSPENKFINPFIEDYDSSPSSVSSTSSLSPQPHSESMSPTSNIAPRPQTSAASLAPIPNHSRSTTHAYILNPTATSSSTYHGKIVSNRIIINNTNHMRSYIVRSSSSAAGTGNMLTKEEKRLLALEGKSVPEGVALTKGEERLLKKVRRKIRNKESAMQSRRRKKQYVEDLESRVQLTNSENERFRVKIDELQRENAMLKAEVTRAKREEGSGGLSKQTRLAAFLLVFTCSLLPHLSPMLTHLAADPSGSRQVAGDQALSERVMGDIMQHIEQEQLHQPQSSIYKGKTFPFAGKGRTLLSVNHLYDPSIQPQAPSTAAVTADILYTRHKQGEPADTPDTGDDITGEEAAWFGENPDSFKRQMKVVGGDSDGIHTGDINHIHNLDFTSGNEIMYPEQPQTHNGSVRVINLPGDERPMKAVVIVDGQPANSTESPRQEL